MLKKSYIIVAVLLLCFFVFRVFIVNSCSSRDSEYAVLESHSEVYVGDQACVKCHKEEHGEWKQSHHYMSMLPPNDSTVKGDFNNVTFTADGVTSRFFKKGTKFFINTEGSDGVNHDFEVKYIFGFTPLQQYLVSFPDGRMQVPRLSWNVKQKKWFNQYAGKKIPSHDWMHWTGNSQNWNTMCASCHSTNLKKNYDLKTDAYKTTFSVVNVSCESCHGPGQQHLEYLKGERYKDGEKIKGSFLKLSKNSSQTEQLNTCAPCHARATDLNATHIKSLEIMDNYIPQIPDTEFYQADGQVDDEDYIYASFLQSKMYSKGVKCSDCHNIHSTKLKRVGNNTCVKCHTPSKYDTPSHTFHPIGDKSSACISCHMLSKLYMGNDLRHDHSFRVPRPDLSERYGTTNACFGCHKDKSDKVLATAIVKWYGPKRKHHFADDLVPGSQLSAKSEVHLLKLVNDNTVPNIIKATAAFYLGNILSSSSLQTLLTCLKSHDAQVRYRALRSLENFAPTHWISPVGPLLSDKVRAVRIAAAELYITIPLDQIPSQYNATFTSAHIELKNYLLYQTDFSVGNVMVGDYYFKLKEYSKAEDFYLKGLKKDAQMNYALINLSTVYNIQGKNDKSLQALQMAQKNDPKNERIYYNMGLLYNEMNNRSAAEKAFSIAIELKTQNPKVYYNFGVMLTENNKLKEAESVLLKGIRINPSDPELYYAIAFVYIKKNDKSKAMQALVNLKSLDPNNPNYQQLFGGFGI
jgi:tetratricopeptide (TPR) repeat protein